MARVSGALGCGPQDLFPEPPAARSGMDEDLALLVREVSRYGARERRRVRRVLRAFVEGGRGRASLRHLLYIEQRRDRMKHFTALVEWDPETKLYAGSVPGVPGAHTQGETLDELQKNLKEVLELCLEENPSLDQEASRVVGLQQVDIAV